MQVKSSPDARRRGRPDLPLRIALVHGFGSPAHPRGEDEAVRDQAAALRRIGCEVSIVGASTDDRPRGLLRAARTGAELALGLGRCPDQELRQLQPHVVHVHNLFPAFARGWLRRWAGPLIATVHNYRPMCAAATLFRDGQVCTRCLDGSPWTGVRHRCFRQSAVATVPLALAARRGAARDPLLSRADRIAVPSQLSWDLYRKAGLPVERLALLPHFVPQPPSAGAPTDGVGRWAYVGRLSREKGVVDMLRRWPTTEPLDVVGDGDLARECRRAAPPSVRFVGTLDREEVRRRMPWWTGLVFPSRGFESAPLVYPEALAAGLPVVAWAGSSVAYAVRLHETGAVVGRGERLGPILDSVRHRRPSLREHCRHAYQAEFSEARWAELTLRVYRQAAQRRVALQTERGTG
ncbi:hypothetical protein DN069_09510 [Streptacidiphilus pinicola]|uniref:Glycosyltransferase subfamily 4-like N-terminal domain-containing protein n=1 Tax=Streptacidiphilus pinicola TaxID=2219663 RepID=A0A2X0JDL8_9ACTN|nr:glycosyltransferase family 4 protein [Streptacidiphilus pinicola]RAG85738.1 hypothetical protein DN069_09510 [Streptacidiphilus pinicola]